MQSLRVLATTLLLLFTVPALQAAPELPDIDEAVSNIRPGMRFVDVKVPWVLKNCLEFFKTESPGCPVKGRIPTPFGIASNAIIDGHDGVVSFITYTYPLDESVYQKLLTAALRLGIPTTKRERMFGTIGTVHDEFTWTRNGLKYTLARLSGQRPPGGPEIDEIQLYVVRARDQMRH
jgi:hypothetical protein